MKALICTDEHGFNYKGKIYLSEFVYSLAERYLNVYDKIKYVVRIKYVEKLNTNQFVEVTNDRIDVCPITFFQGILSFIKNILRISKDLRGISTGCDVFIVRLPSTIGFFVYYRIRKIIKVTGVELVANPKELYLNKRWKAESFFYYIYHLMQKDVCQKVTAISYVTSFSLQKIYPGGNMTDFVTNYSSADIEDRFFTGHRKGISKKNGISLCHVSHPIKTLDKGHLQVIDIIADLRKRKFNVFVNFAGDGELVSFFKSYANKKGVADAVHFVGFLNYEDVFTYLLEADIMVFPTISEGLPRSIIEAMATGMPCVSSPVGGIPELLDLDYLCNYNNIDRYVEIIGQLITNDELYESISIRNFDKSKSFNSECLRQKRNEFYNFLLNVAESK